MERCKKKGCGSYAFNLRRDGIDQGDLCDVHYWQNRAETARRDALEDAANKFNGTTAYNWTAADGYANAFDIASELRYMATETPNDLAKPPDAALSRQVRLSVGFASCDN